MNAEKFFETHSIEEISKKTKISPISLRLIRNKEFEKIPRVKFIGFINILQKTYKVDLSDLIEEYNQFASVKNEEKIEKKEIKTSNNSTFLLTFLAFVLFILGGYFFYSYVKSNSKTYPKNTTTKENNNTQSLIKENLIKTSSSTNTTIPLPTQLSIPKTETNTSKETNTSQIQNKTPIKKLYQVTIIPKQKVWFRALNIDTNTSIEYLTSTPKILPKGNYYIKFGHGNLTIIYNDHNITPDTKKIVRILLKDGNYTYLKKPNRFEK